MRPKLITNLALLAALAGMLVTAQIQPTWARTTDPLDQLKLLVGVRYDLVSDYVTEPDQQRLLEGAVRGMIQTLDDPYTTYFTPEEFADFNKSVSGSFFGIGAEVQIDTDTERVEIVTPLEDSPAWNAGVRAGDLILEIDGEDTEGMKLSEAVKRLTGDRGTQVTVRVRHRDGEEEGITITRDRITVSTVRGFTRGDDQRFDYWLDPDRKVAYVRLTQFNENSVRELEEVLRTLKVDDAAALIFDLRFNPGGLLPAAEAVSDMFLEPGQPVVSVRGRSVQEERFTARSEPIFDPDMPVVVLANEASASAAEIVTGALKENQRAFVVGTRTFGKGSVQRMKSLGPDLGALKLTNAYYYLPSGRNIHRLPILDEDADVEKTWGVDPSEHAYVPMTADQFEAMREAKRNLDNVDLRARVDAAEVDADYIRTTMSDPQLAAALEAVGGYLREGSWPEVGQNNSDAIVARQEREALVRAQSRLQEQLDAVRAELAALDVVPPTLEAGSLEVMPPELVDPEIQEAMSLPERGADTEADADGSGSSDGGADDAGGGSQPDALPGAGDPMQSPEPALEGVGASDESVR